MTERSYADRADGATTFDPEKQFDIDRAAEERAAATPVVILDTSTMFEPDSDRPCAVLVDGTVVWDAAAEEVLRLRADAAGMKNAKRSLSLHRETTRQSAAAREQSLQRAHKALKDCAGCIDAAEAEGLQEVIADLHSYFDRSITPHAERVLHLLDLVERRLLFVRRYAVESLVGAPDIVHPAETAPAMLKAERERIAFALFASIAPWRSDNLRTFEKAQLPDAGNTVGLQVVDQVQRAFRDADTALAVLGCRSPAESEDKRPSEFWAGKASAAFALAEEIKLRKQLTDALKALLEAVKAEPTMQGRHFVGLGIQVTNAISAAERAPRAWECMGRKQALPEPGECNWPDCGCDPHATKVIESLVEQGWTAGRSQPETVCKACEVCGAPGAKLNKEFDGFVCDGCRSQFEPAEEDAKQSSADADRNQDDGSASAG